MKVLKVYGSARNGYSVYLNGEKTSVDEVENSLFFDNTSAYGYGSDNQLVVFESEDEKSMIDENGLKDFEECDLAYGLFKAMKSLPGAGYLHSGEYNKETKTIKVWCERI